MYSMGIPVGMLVDAKGPRPAVILGALLLAAGYFPLHQAYDKGSGSMPLLCIYSFLSGLGGCGAFAASIKTSALNWPHHRGTATGFPLAAFGLSAFFFSMFAGYVMPGSTGDFLLTLACGTFGIVFVGFFFLRVLPHPHYSALSKSSGLTGSDSNRLHRTRPEEAKHRSEQVVVEPGRSSLIVVHSRDGDALNHYDVGGETAEGVTSTETDETSSLMSRSTSSGSGDVPEEIIVKDHAHRVDIRGIRMLPLVEFWQLFALMGILTGIGLMTIK
jgi:hypothetical protein